MKPAILILHAAGVNRDQEAAFACELAGAAPEIVHINQLRRGERRLDDYQMMIIPGGFSYGDALGAGTRLALDLRVFLFDQLGEWVARGKPLLGICNGFQVLVKAGLLPGEGLHAPDQAGAHRRTVTLTENASGHFECRWVQLAVAPGCRAAYLHRLGEPIFCPVAHGEGNFQVQDAATLQRLEAGGFVALRYVDAQGRALSGHYPDNPNGSVNDIAGICNDQGNVLGLMPHPEDHVLAVQNPLGSPGRLGLPLFQAMVEMAG
jgi:phosphoribosylformylglycinamidine synthase